MTTDLHHRLEARIIPILDDMGYELVRIAFSSGRRPILQIMAERKDRAAMTVEDCASISRSLSAILDVDDPISGSYTLEVSSPGIDRPLTRPQDYQTWAGFEAKIDTLRGLDGRKRFRGTLLGLDEDGETVLLRNEAGENVRLPLSDIRSAKLVLTDALIAAVTQAAVTQAVTQPDSASRS